jgi:hypothetical protein
VITFRISNYVLRMATATVVIGSMLGWGGCGSSFESSVSGKVTVGDAPLTKGSVSFHPKSAGPVATGAIGADGSYTVSTGAKGGLPPGDYTVTVVATDPPPPGDPEAVGVLLTPPEYGDVKRTPLSFSVQAGSNTIDLKLTAQPKP